MSVLAHSILDASLFDLQEIKEGAFVDYITIYQDFDELKGDFPIINGGKIINLDHDGALTSETIEGLDTAALFNTKIVEFEGEQYKQLWESVKKMQVKGSHDTSIMIFSDGCRVLVMGNVGRFGRIDNVFNLSFWETIEKINSITKKFGLPPFTKGKSVYLDGKTIRHFGAVVTRIDVTVNIKTGSQQNARHLVDMLKVRSMKHVKKRIYDTSVSWGTGRNPCKAYNKAQEIVSHLKGKSKELKEQVMSSLGYKTALEDGLVRFEQTLDRKTLSETHLRDIENITDEKLAMALKRKLDELFQTPDRKVTKYNPLAVFDKKKHRNTVNAWMLGQDLKDENNMSTATYYRHRKEILAISGIDISVPFVSLEENFGTAQLYQEFELSISTPPELYQLEIDLEKVMPDVDPTMPLHSLKQLDSSEGVIDFQKYIKDKQKEIANIPDYWSFSSAGRLIEKSEILEQLSTFNFVQSHITKEEQRRKNFKYQQAKSKADRARLYQMSKLYEIHKENKRSHR